MTAFQLLNRARLDGLAGPPIAELKAWMVALVVTAFPFAAILKLEVKIQNSIQ